MARPGRSACVLILLLLAFGTMGAVPVSREDHAETREKNTSEQEREYQIKAAFLLNFLRYTTWPKSSFEEKASPVVLLVVGQDPFGKTLEETFENEEANGRKIEVRRSAEVPETIGAHVVFCGESSPEAQARLLEACQARPILTIGETGGFAEDGGCINFYLQDRKTRFEINTDALAEAKLELSPAVLKLARIVRSRRPR